MTDFETHPVGTAARIEQLEADADMMFAKGMSHGQQVLKDTGRLVIVDSPELEELREALTRANAATAAAYEVAAQMIDSVEDAPELADTMLSAVWGVQRDIRALATPGQTAALDRMIADAVEHAAETAAQFVHKRLYEANMPACSYHSRDIKAAILAASKKGGA